MKLFNSRSQIKITTGNSCGDCRACQQAVHRSEEEKRHLVKKLRVIAGQVRGVETMVHDDVHCREILIQISAIENSLKSLGIEMLRSHLKVCVARDVRAGHTESMDEIVDLMRKLDL